MINCIKNKKASILPVTVIAMFIVMIVGYACIKMFLVQNIIATTDQIKIRTRYAAEGLAEKEKSAIYDLIKKQFKEDPNVIIKSDTSLSDTGINNLDKNGQNFSIDFRSKLVANGTDLASSPFVGGEKMYPSIVNASPSNPLSTMDPKDWLSDGGAKFYKSKGVTNPPALYNDFVEINNTVYPNIGTRDPRTIENCRLGETYWQNLGNEYIFVTSRVSSQANFYDLAGVSVDDPILFRKAGTAAPTDAEIISALTQKYPSGVSSNIVVTKQFRAKYVVRNVRKGYVLTASVKSPRIPATGPVIRIPEMTSTVKIYFDVFMTKLCLVCYYAQNYGARAYDWNGTQWTVGPTASDGGSTSYVRGYRFIPDTTKYINDIKFHIQKWEVVS